MNVDISYIPAPLLTPKFVDFFAQQSYGWGTDATPTTTTKTLHYPNHPLTPPANQQPLVPMP